MACSASSKSSRRAFMSAHRCWSVAGKRWSCWLDFFLPSPLDGATIDIMKTRGTNGEPQTIRTHQERQPRQRKAINRRTAFRVERASHFLSGHRTPALREPETARGRDRSPVVGRLALSAARNSRWAFHRHSRGSSRLFPSRRAQVLDSETEVDIRTHRRRDREIAALSLDLENSRARRRRTSRSQNARYLSSPREQGARGKGLLSGTSISAPTAPPRNRRPRLHTLKLAARSLSRVLVAGRRRSSGARRHHCLHHRLPSRHRQSGDLQESEGV